jgi:hypothetical protein
MNVLIAGGMALLLAWGAHVVLWKVRVPRRQTRTLLILFAGMALLAGLERRLNALETVYLFMMVGTVGFAYATFFTTVEADSPSLDILLWLDKAAGGVTQEELLSVLNDDVLVLARLDDLVRCGMVVLRKGRFEATSSGRAFIAVFVNFRRLINAGKGG